MPVLEMDIDTKDLKIQTVRIRGYLDSISKSAAKMQSRMSDAADSIKRLCLACRASSGLKDLSSGFLDAAIAAEKYKTSLDRTFDHSAGPAQIDTLSAALESSEPVLLAYKTALGTLSFAPMISDITAWLSLAPAAMTSLSEMGAWLSMIGVAMGPAGVISAAVGAGMFLKIMDQEKRAKEQAQLLSDAIDTVHRKFSKLGPDVLKAKISDLVAEQKTLRKAMDDAKNEIIGPSELSSIMLNGLSGDGNSTETSPLDKRRVLQREYEENDAQIKALRQELASRPPESVWNMANTETGLSATEKLVSSIRDKIRYLGQDGSSFLAVLDSWQAKLTCLSEDWKKVADLKNEILNSNAKSKAEELDASIGRNKDIKDAIAQGTDKFWSDQDWDYQHGFMSGKKYYELLLDGFDKAKAEYEKKSGGLIDLSDVDNWTPPIKAAFEKLQSLGSGLVPDQLAALNTQLQNGAITQEQWSTAVENLKDQYGDIPNVVKVLDDTLENSKNTSDQLGISAEQWAKSLSTGFADAIVNAKDLGNVLDNILRQMANSYLKGLIGGWLGNFFNPAKSSGNPVKKSAGGNVFTGGKIVPYSTGGIVTGPTLFPMSAGMGLMGEAGPEAVLPLKRGANGKLGVSSDAGRDKAVYVSMTVNAVDASSFTDMLQRNHYTVENIMATSIMNDGSVRKVIREMV